MQKRLSIYAVGTLLAILSTSALAGNIDNNSLSSRLDSARKQTIQRYFGALQAGDPSVMQDIFTSDGTVLSTSAGQSPAIVFFNMFLPKIQSATLTIGNTYQATAKKDWYGASFSYHYILKDGTKGGGSYSDEFNFAPHSSKLQQVIMYENLK